jgi:hypothetical protein
MILQELALYVYKYLIEIEMMFLTRYKISPFEIERHMTMLDMQFFMQTLEKKVEEENEARKKAGSGQNLWKSLTAIRDILNFMTMKD